MAMLRIFEQCASAPRQRPTSSSSLNSGARSGMSPFGRLAVLVGLSDRRPPAIDSWLRMEIEARQKRAAEIPGLINELVDRDRE